MKKALALFLVLVLAVGMAPTVFAAEPPWKFNKDLVDLASPGVSLAIDFTDSAEPGDTKVFTLDAGAFYNDTRSKWATGADAVLSKDVRASKMSIRSKVKKGAICVDEVKLDYHDTTKAAGIYVTLVDPFPSINDIDFEVEVYFVLDGKAHPKEVVTFSGTLCNDVFEIDKNTYYAYLSDGSIAEVKDYVKEVEYEVMDNGGVIVKGPAIKGQKYWAVANNEPTNAEAEIMDKYDIAEIIKIKAIGLDRVAKSVTLDIANPSDYVYDGDLNYLGRAKDPLDFSSVYYLSATMLDVEEEVEPEDEALEEEEVGDDYELPSESGGEGYLDNINDNPGTGK